MAITSMWICGRHLLNLKNVMVWCFFSNAVVCWNDSHSKRQVATQSAHGFFHSVGKCKKKRLWILKDSDMHMHKLIVRPDGHVWQYGMATEIHSLIPMTWMPFSQAASPSNRRGLPHVSDSSTAESRTSQAFGPSVGACICRTHGKENTFLALSPLWYSITFCVRTLSLETISSKVLDQAAFGTCAGLMSFGESNQVDKKRTILLNFWNAGHGRLQSYGLVSYKDLCQLSLLNYHCLTFGPSEAARITLLHCHERLQNRL